MSSDGSQMAPKKGRGTSIPFLIGALVLGLVAYLAGPTLLTYAIYFQEKMSRSNAAIKNGEESNRPRPTWPPSFDPVGGPPPADAAAAGGPGGGQGGGGGFDPAEVFKRRDADNNGKLEGDEIGERMKARMEEIDKDKDGIVTMEEFLAGMPSGRGGSRPPSDQPASEAGATAPEATTPK